MVFAVVSTHSSHGGRSASTFLHTSESICIRLHQHLSTLRRERERRTRLSSRRDNSRTEKFFYLIVVLGEKMMIYLFSIFQLIFLLSSHRRTYTRVCLLTRSLPELRRRACGVSRPAPGARRRPRSGPLQASQARAAQPGRGGEKPGPGRPARARPAYPAKAYTAS